MTWGLLKEVLKDIPEDAVIMSDSGWECDPTDTNGVWYDEESNVVYLTQGDDKGWSLDNYGYRGRYGERRDYICLYTELRPHGWDKNKSIPCKGDDCDRMCPVCDWFKKEFGDGN